MIYKLIIKHSSYLSYNTYKLIHIDTSWYVNLCTN